MAPRQQGGLRVLVSDERGRRVAARGVSGWLARVAPARARGLVSVAFVSLTAYGFTRFRVMAEPGLVVLAAVGVDAVLRRRA